MEWILVLVGQQVLDSKQKSAQPQSSKRKELGQKLPTGLFLYKIVRKKTKQRWHIREQQELMIQLGLVH